jgi:AcrR family transcriptional regulator
MEQDGTRRGAIVEAMVRVAGEKGYGSTSVADVIAEANVSRTTFYKHFANKRECFLAAFETATERIFAAAESACGEEGRWQDRARRGLAAVVDLLAAEPAVGGTAIVEVPAAGEEARRLHSAAVSRLARLLESKREPIQTGDLQPPPHTGLMAVGAVAGLILDELRAGRAENLPRILPELEFALLVPYLGPSGAMGGTGLEPVTPSL